MMKKLVSALGLFIFFWTSVTFGQTVHYVSMVGFQEDWSQCVTPDKTCSMRMMFLNAMVGDNVFINAGEYQPTPLVIDGSNAESYYPFQNRESVYEQSCVVAAPTVDNLTGVDIIVIKNIVVTTQDESGQSVETVVGANCYILPNRGKLPMAPWPYITDDYVITE